MKIADLKQNSRFGFVRAADYFGARESAVWTKLDSDTIQQDGKAPVKIINQADEVYTLPE